MMFQILGKRILTPDGSFSEASILVEDGMIVDVTGEPKHGVRAIHADNFLVLPGIIDLHGDAFERQLMPRPEVFFPHELALIETDRQMAANGITTAYHGLTYSWEPGLRGAEAARSFLHALEKKKPHLSCDTKLHLRFETHNIEATNEILQWLITGKVDLLGFNDHTECFWNEIGIPRYATVLESRTGLSNEAYRALLEEVMTHRDQAEEAVERLAAIAAACGVPMASHDDESPDMRLRYHMLGCHISEFPVTREAACAAREIGSSVVLGAPNVLRGRSQSSRRIGARESIAENLCTILTSDYYYPALLQSAFSLERHGILPLAEAWKLISTNPAAAADLPDRGEIAPGKRADLVIVDDAPALPRATAVFVAGKLVYTAGHCP
jgi:alpha-D-ribose 1-methylphosphonate 5-triphosphate diphosphatase